MLNFPFSTLKSSFYLSTQGHKWMELAVLFLNWFFVISYAFQSSLLVSFDPFFQHLQIEAKSYIKRYSWVVSTNSRGYWRLVLNCIQKGESIDDFWPPHWSGLRSLTFLWLVLSRSRPFFLDLLFTHLVKNCFLIRIIDFLMVLLTECGACNREVINAWARNSTMNCDIVIEIAAFFGFLFFCLFLFGKGLSFWVKVFLFNVIALNSKIKSPCGCRKGFADSKHWKDDKKNGNWVFLLIKML